MHNYYYCRSSLLKKRIPGTIHTYTSHGTCQHLDGIERALLAVWLNQYPLLPQLYVPVQLMRKYILVPSTCTCCGLRYTGTYHVPTHIYELRINFCTCSPTFESSFWMNLAAMRRAVHALVCFFVTPVLDASWKSETYRSGSSSACSGYTTPANSHASSEGEVLIMRTFVGVFTWASSCMHSSRCSHVEVEEATSKQESTTTTLLP